MSAVAEAKDAVEDGAKKVGEKTMEGARGCDCSGGRRVAYGEEGAAL